MSTTSTLPGEPWAWIAQNGLKLLIGLLMATLSFVWSSTLNKIETSLESIDQSLRSVVVEQAIMGGRVQALERQVEINRLDVDRLKEKLRMRGYDE